MTRAHIWVPERDQGYSSCYLSWDGDHSVLGHNISIIYASHKNATHVKIILKIIILR